MSLNNNYRTRSLFRLNNIRDNLPRPEGSPHPVRALQVKGVHTLQAVALAVQQQHPFLLNSEIEVQNILPRGPLHHHQLES
jgi:hypothetical protein